MSEDGTKAEDTLTDEASDAVSDIEESVDEEQPVEESAGGNLEAWWSITDPSHTIWMGGEESIKFSGYRLVLDLEDAEDVEKSEALKRSPRFGRDIFIIGGPYEDSESEERKQLLRTLRRLPGNPRDDNDPDKRSGTACIRGLFSHKELLDAGLPSTTEDVDELIDLAIRTKSVRGEVI